MDKRRSTGSRAVILGLAENLATLAGVVVGVGLFLMPHRFREIVLTESDPAPEIRRCREQLIKALDQEALRWPLSTPDVEAYMQRYDWDIDKARSAMSEALRRGTSGMVA